MTDDTFGCSSCYGAPAETVSTSKWQRLASLIAESHFSIRILACPSCNQRWLSIFTETIDWVDGEDPQYWSLLPITVSEADELMAQGQDVSTSRIMELGRTRRYLQKDFPKGKDKRIVWANGNLLIGPYD